MWVRIPPRLPICHCSLIGLEHKTFNLVDAGSSPVGDANCLQEVCRGVKDNAPGAESGDVGSSPADEQGEERYCTRMTITHRETTNGWMAGTYRLEVVTYSLGC